ncbi:hypothetical protein DPMN_170884 [Dreissena polymorpha]|uniref:Uncharacterized protein n=1 Tax=Dreissena polymorpha TaxID=45954 RepID=A0A9D4IBX8_DREPO|nr:hypothetical protein DPMN_170884 [Dreissena polymorpha]
MMEKKLKRSQSSGQFLHLNLDKPVIKSDYYPPKRNSLVQMPELMTSAKSAGEANFPSKKAMLLRSTTQAASEGIGTFAKNFVISEDVEVSSISSSLKTGEITGTARSNNKTDGKLHLPPIFPASKNTEFDSQYYILLLLYHFVLIHCIRL